MWHAARGWERVEDWIPCAMGAYPSVTDCNGRLPSFVAAQPSSAPPPQIVTKPHASPMDFAMQSANPNQPAQQSRQAIDVQAEPQQNPEELFNISNEQHSDNADPVYQDYWQRFGDTDVAADVHAGRLTSPRLLLQGTTVKVL